MMRDSKFAIRVCLWAFVLCAATAFAQARSAEDYYHGAAYRYIEGKIQEAAAETEEGLRAHPDDARLRMLAEQLRKMQDRQKGNSGQNPEGGKKPEEPQDGKDRGQGQNDPGKPGDGNRNPDDPNAPKNPPPPENAPPPGGSGQGSENPPKGGQQDRPLPGRMSEEDAERLLNSFADDEKKEQAERRRILRPRPGTEQDW